MSSERSMWSTHCMPPTFTRTHMPNCGRPAMTGNTCVASNPELITNESANCEAERKSGFTDWL